MARYSNSNNSYQTLRGYKHVWCYRREPELRRIKKTRFVWKYPCKNWYNYRVTFHGIVMLVVLCVFFSRACWLSKRGPTWLHKSSLDCARMLTFRHYDDVIIGAISSLITSLTIVYSIVYSDADQRKHQRPASLAFVRGIHRGPVNSPHKWPVTRKMFPFDDVIIESSSCSCDTQITMVYIDSFG